MQSLEGIFQGQKALGSWGRGIVRRQEAPGQTKMAGRLSQTWESTGKESHRRWYLSPQPKDDKESLIAVGRVLWTEGGVCERKPVMGMHLEYKQSFLCMVPTRRNFNYHSLVNNTSLPSTLFKFQLLWDINWV